MDEARYSQSQVAKLLETILRSGGVAKRAENRIKKLNDKLNSHLISFPIALTYFPSEKKKKVSNVKKPKNAWQLYLGETVANASAKWKKMTDKEKSPFTKKAKKLYDEYLEEKAEEDAHAVQSSDSSDVDAAPVTKKKIGKLPKKKVVSSDEDSSSDDDVQAPIVAKKKRGRPPKKKVVSSSDEDSSSDDEPQVKKKKGRPLKKKIEEKKTKKKKIEYETEDESGSESDSEESGSESDNSDDESKDLSKIFTRIEELRKMTPKKLISHKTEVMSLMKSEQHVIRVIALELITKMEKKKI